MTCINEIMENELKAENEKLKRRLDSALAALDLLESTYRFVGMKTPVISINAIPGYSELKKMAQ